MINLAQHTSSDKTPIRPFHVNVPEAELTVTFIRHMKMLCRHRHARVARLGHPSISSTRRGVSERTATSSTIAQWTKAATSRRGKSRNCSRPSCGRRLDRSGSCL
jgi:hypothetical protein